MLYAMQLVFIKVFFVFGGCHVFGMPTANKRREFFDDLMDACDEVLFG